MGYTEYNLSSRKLRAATFDYASAPMDKTFTQQKERKAHESMIPKGVIRRECFDSDIHPLTVPILLGLDVTGSMRMVPHELIKNGLPTLMSTLIQRGLKDASLLFVAIGDHESDRYPLQIGQFESGDAELDMWLTRTYLEGGGGGNAGESYLLAYYFAAFHTEIDSFNKRGEKGFLITIGDEPPLMSLPASALKEIMGDAYNGQNSSYSIQTLLEAAQKKYHVFHIDVLHRGGTGNSEWKKLLGQKCITVEDYTTIPTVVANLVADYTKEVATSSPSSEISDDNIL
jgi:hypothetical protein